MLSFFQKVESVWWLELRWTDQRLTKPKGCSSKKINHQLSIHLLELIWNPMRHWLQTWKLDFYEGQFEIDMVIKT